MLVSQPLHEGEAVNSGELDVEENQIGYLALYLSQGKIRVSCCNNTIYAGRWLALAEAGEGGSPCSATWIHSQPHSRFTRSASASNSLR